MKLSSFLIALIAIAGCHDAADGSAPPGEPESSKTAADKPENAAADNMAKAAPDKPENAVPDNTAKTIPDKPEHVAADNTAKTIPDKPEHVTADNMPKNAHEQPGMAKMAADQGETESDRTISQQIRKQFVSDDALSMNAKKVKVTTAAGVVTLLGPVDTAQEREAMAGMANKVDGVKRIDNQLEIAAK